MQVRDLTRSLFAKKLRCCSPDSDLQGVNAVLLFLLWWWWWQNKRVGHVV
jgi:hypothetical protein